MLIHPLQYVRLVQIPAKCLDNTDTLLRSTVENILPLTNDVPNSMLYVSKKFRHVGFMNVRLGTFSAAS